MSNSDICHAYVGLLVQGKPDLAAIEGLRGNTFFKQSLGIGSMPSSLTLLVSPGISSAIERPTAGSRRLSDLERR